MDEPKSISNFFLHAVYIYRYKFKRALLAPAVELMYGLLFGESTVWCSCLLHSVSRAYQAGSSLTSPWHWILLSSIVKFGNHTVNVSLTGSVQGHVRHCKLYFNHAYFGHLTCIPVVWHLKFKEGLQFEFCISFQKAYKSALLARFCDG